MKKIKIMLYLLLVILSVLAVSIASAQAISRKANDRVIFLNGDSKEGTVTNFTKEKISFVHCDETLDYEFNKKEIERIEFASGRTEYISVKKAASPSNLTNTRNRVAVLPIEYIADGNAERTTYMHTFLQEIAISYLSRSATELIFLDANEINARLLKNEITSANSRQYTPKELANILEIEYVIMGSVLQDKGKLVTVVNQNTNKKQTVQQNSKQIKISGKSNSHAAEVTRQDIETQVSFSIYSETGQKIYDNSRRSILSDADAYKNAIKYLLKRTPLYKR